MRFPLRIGCGVKEAEDILEAFNNNVLCVCTQVGRGAKEVEEILEAFNINAGNPAVVMPQDTAREFGSEAGSAKKYKVGMDVSVCFLFSSRVIGDFCMFQFTFM